MLFHSREFIFLFLPVTLVLYFLLNRLRLTVAAKAWLALASLFFYGWWDFRYLALILSSALFNYGAGRAIIKLEGAGRKAVFVLAVSADIALLGVFKYLDFFISNVNYLSGAGFDLLQIALPLGISFFTFTQIAYLADACKGRVREYSLVNYTLFVTFFPHLLAGPIIHHSEMMPQFDRLRNKLLDYGNLAPGIYLFALGLFKKLVIADTFAVWANRGFASAGALTFYDAWTTSLSYTLQLYFDFSGYTDMALGSALMFNIRLPINFNSPYKALDIQDFWRRWHITLSRFLKDYVYIPLGGNRMAEPRVLANLLATFLIGGAWHGAGWTFILWGLLHGAAVAAHRVWKRLRIEMPDALAWFLTFNFVNAAWVFFRAESIDGALKVLKAMAGLNGFRLPSYLSERVAALVNFKIGYDAYMLNAHELGLLILIFLPATLLLRNSNEATGRLKTNWLSAACIGLFATYILMRATEVSEFIYSNF